MAAEPIKILTIVGARPQFIKAAALSVTMAKHSNLQEVLVHTGQHYDANMSAVFFDELGIPKPKYQLPDAEGGHGVSTGAMMQALELIMLAENPDAVLVYGDTNSTLAGALVASKLQIKLVHVEAGLRSFNMVMPEEQNRRITDLLSDILFCPSKEAVLNLSASVLRSAHSKIEVVGDIMLDAFQLFLPRADESICENLPEKFALLTLHRAENTDTNEVFESWIKAVNETAALGIPLVFPVHPRIRVKLKRLPLHKNVHCLAPVSYLEMLALLKACSLVLTDSGGLQKEAYYAKKYCFTLRHESEWSELVAQGCNVLVGANKDKLPVLCEKYLKKPFVAAPGLYGDGKSAQRICEALLQLQVS